jgi:hypothetical protein
MPCVFQIAINDFNDKSDLTGLSFKDRLDLGTNTVALLDMVDKGFRNNKVCIICKLLVMCIRQSSVRQIISLFGPFKSSY